MEESFKAEDISKFFADAQESTDKAVALGGTSATTELVSSTDEFNGSLQM